MEDGSSSSSKIASSWSMVVLTAAMICIILGSKCLVSPSC